MSRCGFLISWRGHCENEAPCEKHKDLRCVSCDAPATQDCEQTMGLVCGALLCDNCEHKPSGWHKPKQEDTK